jgi:hypothetical protein
MKLFFFLIFLLNTNNYPKEINLKGIKYYDSNTNDFSENSNILISNDIIKNITKNRTDGVSFYALPTFCDLGVTLGTDSLGGANTSSGIFLALNSFLFHGFSHIYSINNPPYLSKLISKKKISHPYVKYSQKAIIYSTNEYSNLPEEIYTSVKNEEDALKQIQEQIKMNTPIIYLLNRYSDGSNYYFDSEFFRKVNKINSKSVIFISSFGDKTGNLDSIRSGMKFIQHPLSTEISKTISNEVLEKINYIPELNVYRNLYIDSDKEESTTENEFLGNFSKYYKKYYYPEVKDKINSSNYDFEKYEKIKKEYVSYSEFLRENKYLSKNLIISGGSGNKLSFPGISAIRELLLLNEILDNPYSLVKALTKNSCSLFADNYNGVIREGEKANLLLYKENPFRNERGILNFDRMYIDGEIINKEEIREKDYKKSKN